MQPDPDSYSYRIVLLKTAKFLQMDFTTSWSAISVSVQTQHWTKLLVRTIVLEKRGSQIKFTICKIIQSLALLQSIGIDFRAQ